MATPTIHQAAGRGALPLVRRLVEEEPRLVNKRDAHGKTPLMHAAQWGMHAVVLFLLDNGAAVNRVDFAGRSALHWTAPTGASLKTIALLLERGVDPSLTSRHHVLPGGDEEEDEDGQDGDAARYQRHQQRVGGGHTFLMRACSFGYDQVVRLLLQHKNSDVDARDAKGRAALHYACETGKASTARLLLDFGADPFLRDAQGRSPLGMARMWDCRECVQVLEDWEKANLLRWLRRLQDAVDAHAFASQTVQAPLVSPSWLTERAREGRPLPRIEVRGVEESDGGHEGLGSAGGTRTISISITNGGGDGQEEDGDDDDKSTAEQRCPKRSRPVPEIDGEAAAGPVMEAKERPDEPQLRRLAAARAALHFSVVRRAGGLPEELFRELVLMIKP